jgi:predicted transcriptional regulator
MNKSFNDILSDLLEMCIASETNDPFVLTVKAQEELGEFAEAILNENDKLRNKHIETNLVAELADTFMVMVAAVSRTYPNTSKEELLQLINLEFERKLLKYKKAVNYDDRT